MNYEKSEKYEVLKRYFGYDSFREGQEMLIDGILDGRDVLAAENHCVIRFRH